MVKMDSLKILITGATIGGIGFETALSLASKGHKLILTCRTLERADKAANMISSCLNCTRPRTYALDLSEEQSILQFSKSFL